MRELVQLDRRLGEFEKRGTKVIAASMEGPDTAKQTQAQFPGMTVLADKSRGLSEATGVVHPHAGPDGGDIDAPTTVLVDKKGVVRWLYRSPSIIARLSPDDLLAAVEARLR